MGSIKGALRGLALVLLPCAILAIQAVPTLAAATLISTCQTLSGNNVIYQLSGPITATAVGNCLILTGKNSALDLAGNSITGLGKSQGSGIWVKGSHDLIEGNNGFVTNFKSGVTDDGQGTAGDDINLDGNTIGLRLRGYADSWANMEETEDVNGIWFDSCDHCGVALFVSFGNSGDGVLVENSDSAKIDLFTVADNALDGIHVGSTDKHRANKAVKVVDGFAGEIETLTIANAFGIVLDTSEKKAADQVALVLATGNTSFDLDDETAVCGSNPFNLWFENVYGTAEAGGVPSPSCIQASVSP